MYSEPLNILHHILQTLLWKYCCEWFWLLYNISQLREKYSPFWWTLQNGYIQSGATFKVIWFSRIKFHLLSKDNFLHQSILYWNIPTNQHLSCQSREPELVHSLHCKIAIKINLQRWQIVNNWQIQIISNSLWRLDYIRVKVR